MILGKKMVTVQTNRSILKHLSEEAYLKNIAHQEMTLRCILQVEQSKKPKTEEACQLTSLSKKEKI